VGTAREVCRRTSVVFIVLSARALPTRILSLTLTLTLTLSLPLSLSLALTGLLTAAPALQTKQPLPSTLATGLHASRLNSAPRALPKLLQPLPLLLATLPVLLPHALAQIFKLLSQLLNLALC
jgi:hypothetical protein